MASASPLKYLAGYPDNLRAQVQQLLDQGRLGEVLLTKYPQGHGVRTDKALYDYVMALKSDFLRSSEPLSKVAFDSKLHVIAHALGTQPVEFLRMITVHELAHIKEKAHDKAFYQLCTHMEPQYHQYEFDLRVYLTHMDVVGKLAWPASQSA
jgi:predicted metal-dependent hydrolase